MEKDMKSMRLNEEEKEALRGKMGQTVAKVVDKLLFELRDQVDTDTLRQCVEVLEQVYEKSERKI